MYLKGEYDVILDMPGVAERCFQRCEVYHLHGAVFSFGRIRHLTLPPMMTTCIATPQLDLVEELGEERDVSGSITRSLRFINIQSSEYVRLKTRIHYIRIVSSCFVVSRILIDHI